MVDISGFVIPDTVTNLNETFAECTSLEKVSFSTETYTGKNLGYIFYNCYNLKSVYVPSETAKSNLISALNSASSAWPSSVDKNTTIKVFYETTFADLDSLLQSLTVNTSTTPYGIKITDLTVSNCASSETSGTLGYILRQNSTKYVDLTLTNLPNGLTSFPDTFYNCATLTAIPAIPNSITDLSNAFVNCSSLTDISSLIIPNSITNIEYIFSGCSLLTDISELTIPSSITNIESAFYGCTSLTKVTLNIEDYTNINVNAAFYDCDSLQSIYVPSSAAKTSLSNKLRQPEDLPSSLTKNTVIKINYGDGYVYFSDLDNYLKSLATNSSNRPYKITVVGLTTANLGSSTSSGTLGAILKTNTSKYVDLSLPELPNGLTSLYYVFYNCTTLAAISELTIPSSITNMSYMFYGCSNLGNISLTIPDSVTNMSYMFYNCRNINDASNIIIGTGAPKSKSTNMSTAFYQCTIMEQPPTILSNNITDMSYAFQGCSKLKTPPRIPDGVTTLYYTFASCTALTYLYGLTIPSSVTNMSYTFYATRITNLSFLTIPSNVTTLNRAFASCTELRDASSLIIPNNTTGLAYAFYYCTKLEKGPTIPSTVTDLYYTFSDDSALKEVTINILNYTNVSVSYAFKSCVSLEAIRVPNAVAKTSLINKLGSSDFPSTLDKNTVIKVGYSCLLSELNDLLASLPANTTSTPYIIEITDLSSRKLGSSSTSGTLGYILNQNSTKYVDLNTTELPNTVTSLTNTFNSCTTLIVAPTIPDTVTDLTNAFSGCTNLTNVTSDIPDYTNVTVTGAFYNCTSLERIDVSSATARTSLINELTQPTDFPSSLDKSTIIKFGYSCTLAELDALLKSLSINSTSTPYIIEVTDLTTANCGDSSSTGTLGYILKQNSTKYVDLSATSLPSNLTTTYRTFWGCTSLVTSPTIPSTVTNMRQTFSGCTSLTTAPVIPNSVTNMESTFEGCTSLTTAPTLPNSITSLSRTFKDCALLTTAPTVPSGVTNMYRAFYGCSSLTTVPTLPNSITSLEDTFYNCSSLTTAPVIPSGVKSLLYTFYGCSSLTTAPVIPSGVTNMSSTFKNCTSLTDLSSLTIPSGVTSLSNTFSGCKSLTSLSGLVIPNSVTSINSTFSGCTGLTDLSGLVIPNSVTNMSNTFYGCTSLVTAPEIPNSVTNMSDTFYGCSSLVNVPNISNQVTILSWTFHDCTSLVTAPVIPEGVTDLTQAFYRCTSLTTVPSIPSSVTVLTHAFSSCTNLKTVISNIEDYTNVVVASSFYNCTKLQSIYVPDATAKTSLSNKLNSGTDIPSSIDKNTVIKAGFVTTLSGLNSMLQALPANTTGTPYKIEITDLTAAGLGSSSTSGTLGYILKQNPTKYVDLTNLDLPDNLTSLNNTFNGCTTVIKANIPDTVTDLTNAFSGCTNLTNVTSDISDYTDVTVTGAFYNCTNLEQITVPTAEARTGLINKLTQPADFPSTLDKDEVINYCYVCTLSELDALLTSLAENTTSTPYKIKVTGLIAANVGSAATSGTLGNILRQHKTKYIDLSETELPSNLTSLNNTFNDCSSVIYAPAVPDTVTDMTSTYRGVNNLAEIPEMPSGVTTYSYTFRNCWVLTDASDIVIPSTATNVAGMFSGCYDLEKAPEIPSTATTVESLFNECESLRSVKIDVANYLDKDVTTMFGGCTNLRAVYVPDYTAKDTLTSKLKTADWPSTLDKEKVIKTMLYYNVSNYLSALQNQRADLADNITEKGVEASESEKLDTLVPKVLDISGGGDSPVVEPYAILTAQGWVGSGNGLYTAQTNSGNTTLCFNVTAGKRYIIMASDQPGTRFRWMFSTVDCSPNTQNVQGTSVYNGTTVAAYFTYTYIPTATGYLTGTVDNASAFDTRAYLIDVNKIVS